LTDSIGVGQQDLPLHWSRSADRGLGSENGRWFRSGKGDESDAIKHLR
jgi:hypothetical protein